MAEGSRKLKSADYPVAGPPVLVTPKIVLEAMAKIKLGIALELSYIVAEMLKRQIMM